ncbi:MAG: Asp23/Gls24 family envelope stress response protein [Gordonia sp. (in: high G+C Gram-positive bacteria)]|uniref:Asp23/Gls24 family envelope stress response protein n=1 Tax=Gordonia sp. (in: high G+C Gram-positive bacteria) TaxID=84139 RepID=UPI0039E4C481
MGDGDPSVAPDDAPAPAPVAGTLVLADRVGAAIAERAALDVGSVVAYKNSMGSMLGDVAGARAVVGGGYPKARIDMGAATPRLAVAVALAWPSPITRVCRELRTHLAEELERLTGVRPVAVDVEVARLVPRTEAKKLRSGMIELPPPETVDARTAPDDDAEVRG